jgi:hypothetical protein
MIKKINSLFLIVFVLLVSCTKDDKETATQENTKSIALHLTSKNAFINTTIKYTVTTDNKTDITGDSKLFVDGKEVQRPYTLTKLGKHTVYATYNDLKTNEETIVVDNELENAIPPEFKKKVLIEDCAGTWCWACPFLDKQIAELEAAHDNSIIAITIHYNDEMSNDLTNAIVEHYNISTFPGIFLEREKVDYLNGNKIKELINNQANAGIGIGYFIDQNTLDIQIDIEFKEKQTTINKLAVYLMENGILKDQKDENGTIENYEHNHVLRHAFTDKFGDQIPVASINDNNTYSIKYKGDVKNLNKVIDNFSEVEIVAVITNSENKVVNAQKLKIK